MLPSDRYIAEILGLTEAQYRHFQIEARKRAAEGPQPAVTAATTAAVIAIVNLVIGLGSIAVSLLLKPSAPKTPGERGQPTQRQEEGGTIIRNSRFAPRYGFDSQQDIATLGSIIPIVYARKETISGTDYGGIRINMPMVWNQVLSLGGGQMIRGVFLLSEGTISNVDPNNFAIGNSTLQGYIFDSDAATEAAARVTLYLSKDGGRIADTDRVAGRLNANDDGSSSSSDVFQVYWNGAHQTDFCSSSRPSTQTTFGVYAPIGNNLMFKVNPVMRPGVRSQSKNANDDGDVRVECPADTQQMNQRDKIRAPFTTFSGLNSDSISGDSATRTAAVGDNLTYKIFSTSHASVVFDNYVEADADNDDATAKDVASTVASMQKSWDDSIVVGELYKIGSALGVCTGRTANKVFVSDYDASSGGQTIEATFKVVRSGQVKEHKTGYLTDVVSVQSGTLGDLPNREVGTTGGHLFKYASASISTSRPCRAFEIGFKSVMGSRIAGLCNFQEAKKYLTIDRDFCKAFAAEDPENILNIFHQSGTITTPFERYSFVRIRWRKYGSPTWNYLNNTYGFRSESQQAVFNFLRFEFIDSELRQVEFEPLTGFEVRNSLNTGAALYVLDTKNTLKTITENNCTVAFNGESITLSSTNFGIKEATANTDISNLYRYKARVDGNTHSANVATAFTIAQGATTAASISLSITANSQGNVNLPLIKNGVPDSVIANGQRDGAAVAFGSFIIGQTYTITVVGDTPWNLIGATAPFNVGNTFTANANGSSQAGTTGSASGLSAVTVTGTLTRTDGLPSDNNYFTFVASSSMPSLTTFSAGSAVTLTEDNKFFIYKGLPKVDADVFIDSYAKLAEAFIYSEISCSAESGPEHEIVYINEIVSNSEAPLYENLALAGINIRSSAEFQQFSQFSAYVTGGRECARLLGGTGATHLFPDILYDLMTNDRFGAGSFVKNYMIDSTEFTAAAQWCQERKYFYDGAVSEPVNVRQWSADLAATHLLQFGESDGKYFLRPAISFTAVPIAALFTAGNIAENSFKLSYFDPEDRDPIQVSVRYREERTTTDPASPGLFPVVREVLVREASASATDPIEQIDMSAYCTSREHAIDAAKFIIRMRRIPQHVINFSTTHEGVMSNIAPGDYIKVAMDETEYDEFNNGAVTPEGALVSTKALVDGAYSVIAWDGSEGTPPADATLTVSNGGKTATPLGVVFTVKIASTQMRVYQIERITSGDDGLLTIEAMHMPVNSSGVLKVADGFDAAENWSTT